jgi:hypothetical protein
MTPPSLPYKQLAASLLVGGAMLLAARAGDGRTAGPGLVVGVGRPALVPLPARATAARPEAGTGGRP